MIGDAAHELYRVADTLESIRRLSDLALSGGLDEDDYEAAMVMARDLAAYARQKVRNTAEALDRATLNNAETAQMSEPTITRGKVLEMAADLISRMNERQLAALLADLVIALAQSRARKATG